MLSFSWLDLIPIYAAKKGLKACTQLILPYAQVFLPVIHNPVYSLVGLG